MRPPSTGPAYGKELLPPPQVQCYGHCIVSMILVGESFLCRISDTYLFKKW